MLDRTSSLSSSEDADDDQPDLDELNDHAGVGPTPSGVPKPKAKPRKRVRISNVSAAGGSMRQDGSNAELAVVTASGTGTF
eukprot:SAG31_NODE_1062_length_10105_cov_11.143814_7_plen_81_part_00